MKLLKLIIALTIGICSVSYAQVHDFKNTIKYGPYQYNGKKPTFGNIFSSNETSITTIVSENNKGTAIKLQRFDLDLNLITAKVINLKAERKNLSFHTIIDNNDKYYVLSTFKNQKLKKNVLCMQTINKETLELNDDFKILDALAYPKTWKANSGFYESHISEDKSKILIYNLSPRINDENQKIGISVYNSSLELLWKNQSTLPDINKNLNVQSVKVNNSGNVFLLAEHYDNGKRAKIKNGSTNLSFKLLSYGKGKNNYKSFDIKHSKYFAEDLRINFNKNGDLICSGYYSTDNMSVTNGIYFSITNGQTLEVKTEKYAPFTQALMNIKGDESPKLSLFELDHVIPLGNQKTLLVGEYYNSIMYSTADGIKELYTFGSICVIKLSSEGEIEWIKFVDKMQKAGTLDNSSYLTLERDNKLYFLFNKKITKIKRKHLNLSNIVSIDLDGQILKSDIEVEPINNRMLIEKYEIYESDNKDVFIYYSSKSRIRMAKLNF